MKEKHKGGGKRQGGRSRAILMGLQFDRTFCRNSTGQYFAMKKNPVLAK